MLFTAEAIHMDFGAACSDDV